MGRQKNRGACADRLRGRTYLRPFNLMRIMPPEEVINDFFTEAFESGVFVFLSFGKEKRTEGERPEFCMTAMGSRVPA